MGCSMFPVPAIGYRRVVARMAVAACGVWALGTALAQGCGPLMASSALPLPADGAQGLYLREQYADADIGRVTAQFSTRMPRCITVVGASGAVYSGCQYSSSKKQAYEQAHPDQALKLDMDIYRAPGWNVGAPRPAVLWLHGGEFERNGRNSADSPKRGRDFAKAGYITAVPNYRLTPYNDDLPDGSYSPDAVRQQAVFEAAEDARNALRYLRANAAKYNIDPTRIAVVGDRAGGALALINAIKADNLTAPTEDGGDYAGICARADVAFSTGATLYDRGQTLAPELFDANDTPVQLYHALTDPHTGASWDGEVAATCSAMQAAGAVCERVQHQRNTHSVLLNLSGPYAADMRPFLWRYLRLADLAPYAGTH